MSDTVICVEGLSKRYRLDHTTRHDTLRDALAHRLSAPWRWLRRSRTTEDVAKRPQDQGPVVGGPWFHRHSPEEFWALRDVSFKVQRGEVLGIIGRNGAGKSTLLKILSRITEPTTGRVTLHGRVASLLEVGTGFHPELTGRENVFLNGAILGMSREEIRRKFDEIVAFAEVEKFLDTPVKRYSSGMYVRLAFAVAAHLEPEILIVDEVLAVGDAQFQNKCLGKIKEVSTEHGRTVLLVSHNMDSILRLCQSAALLVQGRIDFIGAPGEAVSRYAQVRYRPGRHIDCRGLNRPSWVRGGLTVEQLSHLDAGAVPWTVPFGGTLALACDLTAGKAVDDWRIFVAVFSTWGIEVAATQSTPLPALAAGTRRRIDCQFTDFRLTPGTYVINIGVRTSGQVADFLAEAAIIEVLPNEESFALEAASFRGFYVPRVEYRLA
jgi:lipopolysaccharide transport system ATP-binding protein